MSRLDGTSLRVLVPLTTVLVLGVITAAVQQDDEPSRETVVQTSTTPAPTLPPQPTTPRPPAPPTAPTPVAPTTGPPTAIPTSAPPPPPRRAPVTPVPPAPSRPPGTPSPSPFLPGPPTTGTTALDGVQLQVDVDRSQVTAGGVVRVITKVTNRRPTAITYRSACPTVVAVRAATGANASPSQPWSGDRQTFKDLALANLVGAGDVFTTAAEIDGRKPPCTPAPGLQSLAPGRTLEARHAWKAATAYGSGYDGQAPVTASFAFALDALPGTMEPEFSTVTASAPLRLVGEGTSGLVPPTTAIDAALRLPQFAQFVEEGDSAAWEPPYPAGSELGASVTLNRAARPTYAVQLTRSDEVATVTVLADNGTPISITIAPA